MTPVQEKTSRKIFVFGSNLAGVHGAGAALAAWKEHGAIYGQGIGPQGESYAIPTKDEKIITLPLPRIQKYVAAFVRYAALNPDMVFMVTRIGCGLAGYNDEQIAPFFRNAPSNCILPAGWRFYAEWSEPT